MQLKFPKKITIGAISFSLTYEKDNNGGSLSFETEEIKIGIECYKINPEYTLSIIIHELVEAILEQLASRYQPSDNYSNYLFCYKHKEHTKCCQDLAGLLTNFIK